MMHFTWGRRAAASPTACPGGIARHRKPTLVAKGFWLDLLSQVPSLKACPNLYLSLRKRCLHVLQKAGEVLLTVAHYQKNAAGDRTEAGKARSVLEHQEGIASEEPRGQEMTGGWRGHSHLSRWFPTTTSFSSTMLGWWSSSSRVISRRLLTGIPGDSESRAARVPQAGARGAAVCMRSHPCRGIPGPLLPSFSLSIRTFFSATVSSVTVSRARSGRAARRSAPGGKHRLYSRSLGRHWRRRAPSQPQARCPTAQHAPLPGRAPILPPRHRPPRMPGGQPAPHSHTMP